MEGLRQEAIRFLRHHYQWDRHGAQTLYNDACLLVIQQLEDDQIQEVSRPYLFKVCKNLGANDHRRLLRERERFHSYCIQTQEAYQNSVQESYGIPLFDMEKEGHETRGEKALRAYSMLDAKCQEIIKLKFVDGLSHSTISNSIDHVSSSDSAKTLLSRCLKYWRKLNQRLAL